MPKKVLSKKTRAVKGEQWEQLQDLCCKYNKIMFIDVDNVTSKQIAVIRRQLRDIDAHVFMGKNTHMKKAINELIEEPEAGMPNFEARKARWVARPHLNVVVRQLLGNVGMIFSNGDLSEIKGLLDGQAREAPAKPGMLAPSEVTVPAGPTGLDPKQTQFFQALNIQTKIVKAQIEIANPVKIIKEGEKVNFSQAALLEKLKIRPFEYKMHVRKVLDSGKLYPASVLDIKTENILSAFREAGTNITATSLGSGYIVSSAAPHLILNAFKNLACASFGSDYSFPQAAAMMSSGPVAAAAPTKEAPKAAAKEAAKEEEPEEEGDFDMGGLFD